MSGGGGYDEFFKQARRAGGVSSGPSSGRESKQMKFKMNTGRGKATEVAGDRRSHGGGAKTPALTPEEHLRLELARRLRKKKAEAFRRRRAFPVFPAICVLVAFALSVVGSYKPEALDWVMTHIEVGVFGNARAQNTNTAKPASPSPAQEEKAADPKHDAKTETKTEAAPNVRGWTPEELSFFKKLNERKKELDLREAELTKLEEELHKQKKELDEKIGQLEAMRVRISSTLKSRVADDQEKVDKLVQFYSNMKPQQAAKVIETLNEDLAVEVIDKMKKKNAAEIMNMMDSKKARRLSELLTGYQRSPAVASAAASEANESESGRNEKKEEAGSAKK